VGVFFAQKGNEFSYKEFKVENHLGTTKLSMICPYPHTEFSLKDENGAVVLKAKAAVLATMFNSFNDELDLEVFYIGQSYGIDGERKAPDRLMKHSTLQAIYHEALTRSPDKEIWLMLWSFTEIIFTSIDGISNEYRVTEEQDLLHTKEMFERGISEQQKINFTEAALIRYFQPEYNSIFKDTFPTPAHSTYSECYDLDLHTVCVELQTKEVNCRLWSKHVQPKWTHYAVYSLHTYEERKGFLNI
jgi:hypothetical protein